MTLDYQFELPLRVRDYEVDVQGIVNNANYFHYLEHTRHEFCRSAGFSFSEMHAKGIDPVVKKAEIEYIHPLGLGEDMICKLSLKREGARFIFVQDIYKYPGGEPVIKALVTVVCLEQGRLTKGDVLAEAFKEYLQ